MRRIFKRYAYRVLARLINDTSIRGIDIVLPADFIQIDFSVSPLEFAETLEEAAHLIRDEYEDTEDFEVWIKEY